jgi:hypothetical protein
VIYRDYRCQPGRRHVTHHQQGDKLIAGQKFWCVIGHGANFTRFARRRTGNIGQSPYQTELPRRVKSRQRSGTTRPASNPRLTRVNSPGAEIDLLHLRIVGEIGGGAGQYAFADLQYGGEIRDFQRQFDRLLGEQDGQPFTVQSGKRLVH